MYAIIGVIVIIIIAVVALYMTGYFGGAAANVTAQDDGSCSPTGDASCKFSPVSFSVAHGVGVVFKNGGSLQHTVTASPNSTASWSNASNSAQNLNAGQQVTITFSQAGNYSYYCTIHAWMKGYVVVT